MPLTPQPTLPGCRPGGGVNHPDVKTWCERWRTSSAHGAGVIYTDLAMMAGVATTCEGFR
jgi:hypothetical protein